MSRADRSRTHGAGSWGGAPGRVRASDLRASADEMAALLDEAAPRTRRRRRRRSTALPAAVAAFGALSVGGVGLALGLTPTGAEGQLPAAPSPVLADPGTDLPATTTDGAGGATGSGDSLPATVDLDPAVAGADLIRPEERRTDPDGRPAPSSGARATTTTTSTTPTTTPRPTRTTKPRPTRPTRPTVTRSATPRSTTTAAPSAQTASAAPRRVAERSTLPAPGTAATDADPDADPDATDTGASPEE